MGDEKWKGDEKWMDDENGKGDENGKDDEKGMGDEEWMGDEKWKDDEKGRGGKEKAPADSVAGAYNYRELTGCLAISLWLSLDYFSSAFFASFFP